MAEGCTSISCSLKIEAINGQTNGKKSAHKAAKLTLLRNEFREIILQINASPFTCSFLMKNVAIHRRFMKDGKATLTLKDNNVNVMLSNCPPNALLLFLRTLATKLKVNESSVATPVSIKNKLLSEKRKQLQEISPINAKDVNFINAKESDASIRCNILQGKSNKRSLMDENKENVYPKKECKRISVAQALNANKLTPDQERVVACVKSGVNVFFTGKAGTGKSYLLKKIVGVLPPNKTVVTSSTGVSACHIGGITLHAFAGIGCGSGTVEQCIELASKRSVIEQWKKCQHLIVDEISMVNGDFFKKLEHVARVVRRNDSPFGGIQLIVCGDFLQLPPVSKQNNARFCFQTSAWSRCIKRSIVLDDVKRQTDSQFLKILHEIRLGSCSPEAEQILKNTRHNEVCSNGIQATRLCTHKEDVQYTNNMYLAKLPGDMKTFDASDSDPQATTFLDKHSPVAARLQLKKGTQVMLVKNLDVRTGLVNGSRGVIVGFQNNSQALPNVMFMNGATLTIDFEKFVFKAGNGMYMSRKQLPLKLAWAISIHKSQGMTLDCVEISLSKVFECGQAYVALSRARSLHGLRVLDFNKNCVRANPNVLKFYYDLKQPVSSFHPNRF